MLTLTVVEVYLNTKRSLYNQYTLTAQKSDETYRMIVLSERKKRRRTQMKEKSTQCIQQHR